METGETSRDNKDSGDWRDCRASGDWRDWRDVEPWPVETGKAVETVETGETVETVETGETVEIVETGETVRDIEPWPVETGETVEPVETGETVNYKKKIVDLTYGGCLMFIVQHVDLWEACGGGWRLLIICYGDHVDVPKNWLDFGMYVGYNDVEH